MRVGESGAVESERSGEVSRQGLIAWVGMSEEEKKRVETRRSVEGSREKKKRNGRRMWLLTGRDWGGKVKL